MMLSASKRRMMSIIFVISVLVALLIYVALRTGPLAPVIVTATGVDNHNVSLW